jgi:copper chaperone CopZ
MTSQIEMKQLTLGIGLTSLLIALTGCTSEVVLAVPDMMCEESCAVKVREVLAEQPGVRRVNVDFPKRIATLSIDNSHFSADAAVAALVDHGFEDSKLKTDNLPVIPTSQSIPAVAVQPTTTAQ